MGRRNRSQLTSRLTVTSDPQPNGNMSTRSKTSLISGSDECERKDVKANMTSGKSSHAISSSSPDLRGSKEDPDGTRLSDCLKLDPENSHEKDKKKDEKKGRKRKKKEKTTTEKANVCAATVAEEHQNSWPNKCNKNYAKVTASSADAEVPEKTVQMSEDNPPPGGAEDHNMANGKKGKKRRKRIKGHGGHENGRCLGGDDLIQGTPRDYTTTVHAEHASCKDTSTSQSSLNSTGNNTTDMSCKDTSTSQSSLNSTGNNTTDMSCKDTSTSQSSLNSIGNNTTDMQLSSELNRIRAKLEANAAGLEELHLLKQSQLAKVQEALAMVKQRCRPELNVTHTSPPISPSRLNFKSTFSWSYDMSNGSSSSLYNEPISEVDENKVRPRSATFSICKDRDGKMNSEDVKQSPVHSPGHYSTPMRKKFTKTRALSGTQLSYSFPSPMHAVLLQYESLSSIDAVDNGDGKETEDLNEENQESGKHHSIVRRRDIHWEDHTTVSNSDANAKAKKSAKRASDSGLLDMRHILRELSQQELKSPAIDIKEIEYPFTKLMRSASLGAYDKKIDNKKFTRSNSFRKTRSQSKIAKRHADKENDCLSTTSNIKPNENHCLSTITNVKAENDCLSATTIIIPKIQPKIAKTENIVDAHNHQCLESTNSRVRSYSMSEGQSPVVKPMILLRENSVSCSDIDRSPDPNKSSLPPKPKCSDSSDEEDGEKMQGATNIQNFSNKDLMSSTNLSDLHSGNSVINSKSKGESGVMSVINKLRSHGSLDHLFQKRSRNSLSKIHLRTGEVSATEWDYPTRHRSVSDLNPRRRYSTVVFPDMTVISMPERPCSVIKNIGGENNISVNDISHQSELDSPAKTLRKVSCHSFASASQTHSVVRAQSLIKPNYLKLKKRPCLSVAQAAY